MRKKREEEEEEEEERKKGSGGQRASRELLTAKTLHRRRGFTGKTTALLHSSARASERVLSRASRHDRCR